MIKLTVFVLVELTLMKIKLSKYLEIKEFDSEFLLENIAALFNGSHLIRKMKIII